MNFLDGFAEGWIWGTIVGGLALLVGFLAAETARHLGLPNWMTAGLGVWAFLVALAVGWPPEKKA